MIADDNRNLSAVLSEYFTLYPDIEIAGISDNGAEAFDMMRSIKPDILLLDIVIPGIDGLEVLRRIQAEKGRKPSVIVISALYSIEIRQQAFDLGACCFFMKPLDVENLVQEIRSASILRSGNARDMHETADNARDTEEKITAILLENGVPANIQGFRYMRDMIGLFCLQDCRGKPGELYDRIASEHNTTSMRVKKAIHYAVKVAWNRHADDNARGIFHSMQKRPSGQPGNCQFIYAVAGKLAGR